MWNEILIATFILEVASHLFYLLAALILYHAKPFFTFSKSKYEKFWFDGTISGGHLVWPARLSSYSLVDFVLKKWWQLNLKNGLSNFTSSDTAILVFWIFSAGIFDLFLEQSDLKSCVTCVSFPACGLLLQPTLEFE